MPRPAPANPGSRERLLEAAAHVLRAKGYADTTVDDICRQTGLTKGAFFHHFASKEALALAAADHFAAKAGALFEGAPYRAHPDPLVRVLGYIDFRGSILRGPLCGCTCLLGTLVQETYGTHPSIREACNRYISAHAADVARDIALAKQMYAPDAPWTPESLGLFTQAVLQGAFVLAKAANDPRVAAESVAHLRRYVESLLVPARGLRARARSGRPSTRADRPDRSARASATRESRREAP